MIRLKSNRCSLYVLAAMALPLFAPAAVRADAAPAALESTHA